MRTDKQTTTIFLDQGQEDARLFEEIDAILKKAHGARVFWEKNPTLMKLHSCLRTVLEEAND